VTRGQGRLLLVEVECLRTKFDVYVYAPSGTADEAVAIAEDDQRFDPADAPSALRVLGGKTGKYEEVLWTRGQPIDRFAT
jgi:hypothetical protein